MNVDSFEWTIHDGWFWTGTALVIFILVLTLLDLHRRGWKRSHGFVEAWRLLLAAVILVALAKPETWRWVTPHDPARIVVLTDRSASMETEDMDLESGERVSRAQWILRQGEWSQTLEGQLKVEALEFETPDSGQTDLHAALRATGESARDRVAAVVLLSDGDWNAGSSPEEAALALRRRGIPLFAVPVGSEDPLPDLRVIWLPMPETLSLDEPVRLPYRVENRLGRALDVAVSFQAEGELVETVTLSPGPHETLEETFLWKPAREGPIKLAVSAPEVPGEIRQDNNTSEISVRVRDSALKVLLVDSAPRWEFRYLRNALMRDPAVDLSTVLFHPHPDLGRGRGPGYLDAFPSSLEALTDYDVIFLGDVGVDPEHLTEEQAGWVRGLVERQAAGLVFLPGRRDQQRRADFLASPLGDLLPIVWDEGAPPGGVQHPRPAPLELTAAGRESALSLLGDQEAQSAAIWRSLPGFYWHAPVLRAKAGATVLAVHESARNRYGRVPLLVSRPFGSGKVLFLGTDGVWRWRKGVEDRYHYRFWSQVARWMAYQRNLAESEHGRIIHYPASPVAGRDVILHVTLLGGDRSPLTGLTPTLKWKREDRGDEDGTDVPGRLTLTETDGQWGVYRASWTPPRGGTYHLSVELPGGNAELSASIAVDAPAREASGDPARPDVLERLAEAAGGRVVPPGEWDTLPALLGPLAMATPVLERLAWWEHPALLGFLIAGLTIYWIGRKRQGLL